MICSLRQQPYPFDEHRLIRLLVSSHSLTPWLPASFAGSLAPLTLAALHGLLVPNGDLFAVPVLSAAFSALLATPSSLLALVRVTLRIVREAQHHKVLRKAVKEVMEGRRGYLEALMGGRYAAEAREVMREAGWLREDAGEEWAHTQIIN